jgi:PiT family inorganic phosphate transporter
VVLASQLGLPVSSTHIAVGGVFGVGFLREWMDRNGDNTKHQALHDQMERLEKYKTELSNIGEDYKRKSELFEIIKTEKKVAKQIRKALRENYVKRGMVKKIVAAWIITVPAAAILSAIIFFILKGVGV